MSELHDGTIDSSPTRVLLAVGQCTKGYPYPSRSSEHAFNWVLEKLIPRSCRQNFRLLILHVLAPDEDGFDDLDSVYATKSDFKEKEKLEANRALHLLEHFVTASNVAHVPCEAWLKLGNPRHIICEEVERLHPDMLVLGSRNLTTLQEMFVASVSTHCFKHAQCPVLVIKRPPQLVPSDSISD